MKTRRLSRHAKSVSVMAHAHTAQQLETLSLWAGSEADREVCMIIGRDDAELNAYNLQVLCLY
jgi:hypothetical protein